MAGTTEKYFNFPVGLLQNFLRDTPATLNNIVDYAVYSVMQEKFDGNKEKACSFYHITWRNGGLKNGQKLYNYNQEPQPMTGLALDVFWEFYQTYKSDKEKACLLAFLALKSIIGGKSYQKADKLFVLSRMSGKNERQTFDALAEEIKPYFSRYKFDGIIWELQKNWNLKYYADHTRGFYYSFNLELANLVECVEKNKKAYRQKEEKAAYRLAVEAAKKQIPP